MIYNNGYFEIDTNLELVMDSVGLCGLLSCDNDIQEYYDKNYKITIADSSDFIIIDKIYTKENSDTVLCSVYEYHENLDSKHSDFEYYNIKCNSIATGDIVINNVKDILKQEYHKSPMDVPCRLFIKTYHNSITELKDDNFYTYYFYKGLECVDMTTEYVNLFNYLMYTFISCDTNYRENYDDDFDSFVHDFMTGTFHANGHTIREGFLREDEFMDNLKINYDIDYDNEKINMNVLLV